MAEQKESKEASVLHSLKELMNLEENRIKEEEESKKRRAEAEIQARLDAERRAREEEEARLDAEEERRRQDELRRKMEEAQVEAAKHAEIEKRKLEDQHRLQMEALARQQAHEKEIHVIQSQKRKGIHPGAMAAIAIVVIGALAMVVFFVAIKPTQDAREAVKKAQVAATSDEPGQWDEADRQLAIARDKDPTNKDILAVSDKVKKKRDDRQAKIDRDTAALNEKLKMLQTELLSAEDSLKNAHTEQEKKAAQEKLDATKRAMANTGGATKPAGKNCKEVPGCPLCPPVCN